ncbi:MAG: type II secretion system protein [Eubacteriales bacterium]
MNPNNNGFTLIEVLIVIVIMGILATVATPSVLSVLEGVNEQVCRTNCIQVERSYNVHLTMEDILHYMVYLLNIHENEYENMCPKDGKIYYDNGRVRCNYHSRYDNIEPEEEDDEDNNGGVPFL